MALVGVLAVSDLLVALKNKMDIRSVIKCHYVHILTIALDIAALFFEYNGGRASVAPTENFNQTIEDLCRVYSTINKCCLGIMVIVCNIGTIYFIVKRKQEGSIVSITLFVVIITEIITSLYLVALLTKVGDHKFLYTDNLIVLFFISI